MLTEPLLAIQAELTLLRVGLFIISAVGGFF